MTPAQIRRGLGLGAAWSLVALELGYATERYTDDPAMITFARGSLILAGALALRWLVSDDKPAAR
jgi:hypothetical protein